MVQGRLEGFAAVRVGGADGKEGYKRDEVDEVDHDDTILDAPDAERELKARPGALKRHQCAVAGARGGRFLECTAWSLA